MRSLHVVSEAGACLVQIAMGVMGSFSLMITVMLTTVITVTMLKAILDVGNGSDVVEGQTGALTSPTNGDWGWSRS